MPRIASIDYLKLVAAFFVVCIHTKTTAAWDHFAPDSLSFVIDSIARFAVPFFFVSAGYFTSVDDRVKGRRQVRRLVLAGTFWSLFFVLLRTFLGAGYPHFSFSENAPLNELINMVYRIFIYGFERHLWFVPAYLIGISVLYCCHRYGMSASQCLLLGLLCYALGLSGQGWAFLVYPAKVVPFIHETYFTRSGIFLAFPCMALGQWLRRQNFSDQVPQWGSFLMVLLLFALQYTETFFFARRFGYVPDYGCATLFAAASVFVFALSFRRVPNAATYTGQVAGAVYLLHPVFMYLFLLSGITSSASVVFIVLYTPLLFLLSALSGFLLLRIPAIRPLLLS